MKSMLLKKQRTKENGRDMGNKIDGIEKLAELRTENSMRLRQIALLRLLIMT